VTRKTIALVGDYSERHAAHRAIPKALELARAEAGADFAWEWIATARIQDASRQLAEHAAVWIVPASPYENMQGALDAARWAREGRRPVLGTCGGFQHMIIEFARNAAGIPGADHGETRPAGTALVVTQLRCSLAGASGAVNFAADSLLARAYGSPRATEGYNCGYGVNPAYRPALEAAGLRFTSWDDEGDLRGAELASHPFYVGVLFQPERAALRGNAPPLVLAFVRAVAAAA
jgi:CTP synthase (UTP-ammonia lyase)